MATSDSAPERAPKNVPKSTPRSARVVAVAELAAGTRHLTLEMLAPDRLDFAGGQYVIVDSGLTLPSGKAAKRAYSILSSDSQPARFELAVMRIPDGACSGFMHEQAVGAELRFSGPWGKLCPTERTAGAAGPAATLVLATDTGITAALGLVRGRRFAPRLAGCTFVWLRTSSGYFAPESFVSARLPPGLGEVRMAWLPAIDHPERLPFCRQLLREAQRRRPFREAFITGDGAVNYALLDDLVAAGVPATRDSVESFFNMPKKTAPATPPTPTTTATATTTTTTTTTTPTTPTS
jgi:ferredoxin-NADP reductase